MSEDEAKGREVVTSIMGRTGAQTINDLAGKCYVRIKPQKIAGFIGENMKRTNVPCLLHVFEKRVYEGIKQQCIVVRYFDKSEFWVPVTMMHRVFEFIDDVEEEMTVTWIPKNKLEAGW